MDIRINKKEYKNLLQNMLMYIIDIDEADACHNFGLPGNYNFLRLKKLDANEPGAYVSSLFFDVQKELIRICKKQHN